MKLGIKLENDVIMGIREVLSDLSIMRKRREQLKAILLTLEDKIESYEKYLMELDKFEASKDKEWINKDENPSIDYLNEKEL